MSARLVLQWKRIKLLLPEKWRNDDKVVAPTFIAVVKRATPMVTVIAVAVMAAIVMAVAVSAVIVMAVTVTAAVMAIWV
ncbi:MAG TPA: hypothetical protein PKM56_20420, partial [Candidatus Rifleibacterium sp.]|nr:hypothetical protein [Candidatus Rifleibacterium sp.]